MNYLPFAFGCYSRQGTKTLSSALIFPLRLRAFAGDKML
jgi:hypothetical protein